jgi:hypothetical protein
MQITFEYFEQMQIPHRWFFVPEWEEKNVFYEKNQLPWRWFNWRRRRLNWFSILIESVGSYSILIESVGSCSILIESVGSCSILIESVGFDSRSFSDRNSGARLWSRIWSGSVVFWKKKLVIGKFENVQLSIWKYANAIWWIKK